MRLCRLLVNASLASVAALAFATVLEIAQFRGLGFGQLGALRLGRFCLPLFLFLEKRVCGLELEMMVPTYQNQFGAGQGFRMQPAPLHSKYQSGRNKSDKYPKVRFPKPYSPVIGASGASRQALPVFLCPPRPPNKACILESHATCRF